MIDQNSSGGGGHLPLPGAVEMQGHGLALLQARAKSSLRRPNTERVLAQ